MAMHDLGSDYRTFCFKPGEKYSVWYSLNKSRQNGPEGGFEGFEVLREFLERLCRNAGVGRGKIRKCFR
jgi:hypothetical protein